MTGVNTNKIRHYAPGFNSRTTRLDVETAALVFRAGNQIISKSERLIADVSVKVAMPTSPNTDGKKRGLEVANSKKNVNYGGMVFDPEGKKQEGSYFKHYVTESERIEALRSENPVPNWGWINAGEPGNGLPRPRMAVAKVTRFPVNPKTGQPMKSQGFEPELKSLGKTIGERNPGAKLAARAAKAMGLVIDSLGKFRCPPGTPAANRFTNERGEGCFGVSLAQVQSIANSLTNIMSAPANGSRITESLMNIGVSAYEIRKAFKENGVDGLRSLASRAGIGGRLIGDEGEDDPSYFSTVVAKVKENMNATSGAEARMNRIRDEKNRVISGLKDKYGITETDEYLALGQIFKKMSEDPNAPFRGKDPASPFRPDQFELLFMGGSPEKHKNWVIETTVKMHMGVIMRKTGLTRPEEVIKAYKDAKDAGETNVLTNFIDAAVQREEKFRIGAFKEILKEASLRPETFKAQNGAPHVIVVDYDEVSGLSEFEKLNGAAGSGWTHIGSGPAINGYRDYPPPGYMDLYEATGGDIDDQWRAITASMSDDEQSRRWVQTYSTDLAAENGAGWEDFGAQTGAHENTHSKQYNAIVDYLKRAYPDDAFDEMSNNVLWKRITEFIKKADPEELSEVFGIDLDELIERRLDALAGQYSQNKQQEALAALRTGDRDAFNFAKNIAFLETHAELNANREVGLIGDNPEIDEVLDAFMPMSDVPDSVPPSPSGLVIPGAPAHWGPLIIPGAPEPDGGELIIPGRRPDSPIDAPGPVRPGNSARPTRPGRRPARPLPDSAPSLPEGAGRIIEPRRPPTSPGRTPRGPGRTPRGPIDPFEKDRNGKIPRMIKEGRFTTDDIEEHLYGEDGKGGLFGMFRSARNMRTQSGMNRNRDIKKKELLNNLIDTMGVSFSELEEMALKAKRGEPLSSDEKQKLMAAITHLRNGANEFKRKAEEARENFRNYQPEAIDARDQWDDVSVNRANLEAIQLEIEMYDSLFNRVGRGFAPAVHDILTISENGPYPEALVPRARNLDLVRGQSRLSAEEIEIIDSISDNPPISYLSSGSAPDLEFELESNAEVLSAFRRHGMDSTSSVSDRDIDSAVPAMKALDKTAVNEDVVVEIEIDLPEDTEPGSIYSTPSIQSARVVNDEENRSGLASLTSGGGLAAGAAGRLLGSRTGRKLIERLGIDPEQADIVQLVGEMAIGFSAGGPAGAIIPLARRGGRDVGEKALEVMVERGMIDPSVADKIMKHGLNRIASEGLPDEIIKAAEATKDRLLTEENRRKALEMGSTLQDRSLELAEATKEKASELTESAREQASEIAGSARERIKRRREGREKPDAVGPGTPAGWSSDPSTPGQYRYFNGQVWTEHVSDSSGTQSIDNNPLLSNQQGWSEYRAGVSARLSGLASDSFADSSPPDAFSSPSISDLSPDDTEKLISISSPQDARRAIESNQQVRVATEDEAYTILTELAKMANEAKAKGQDAPNYDFCKVSIPGTNLFCGDSKGIPRKKMPQFSGEPTPGSPADSRTKNKKGEVDGTEDFVKYMDELGVKIEERQVLASSLRASQNELVGEKVAGMMTNDDFDPAGEAIFVSRDGYVIDGHHRWAAQVGRDLEDGNIGDLPLNVRVVDMDILEVLEEANKFAKEFGIAPKTAGNDAGAAKSAFFNVQFKQLGKSISKQPEQTVGGSKPVSKKKTKVRVAIPAGSKGKFKDGESSLSQLVVPPGKIKFTGVGEDGQLEAELISQMSASDYMKAIEDTSRSIEKTSGSKKVSSAAKKRADKARQERRNILLSSETSSSQSEIGKMTLDKSESIVEAARDAGLSMFTPEYVKYNEKRISIQEYYDNYEFNLKSSIKEIKTNIKTKIFEDMDPKVRRLISSSSENELRLAVKAVAMLIHNDIDRRARVSMTKSSLEDFLDNGTILNVNVNSQSLELLKKQRDRRLGNRKEISRFSLVPVELMHGTFVRQTEEMLYSYGTRVGSEEFTDSGRGIEIVLRAENAPRIGYGKKNSYEDGGVFSFITEEDERIIELAIFGGDGSIDQSSFIEILDVYISGDPSSLLRKSDDESIEAFIVGEISLNDIEHIKIPSSIFNIRKKKVSDGNRIGGKSKLTLMMRSRKLNEDKIKDFFDKDGTIGGGHTPKYLSYLLEYQAATELKQRLVSFGLQDVLFTNREGIDIMSQDTWQTFGPKKKYGLDALKEIAMKEIESIIDKYAPRPVLKKLPKKKE